MVSESAEGRSLSLPKLALSLSKLALSLSRLALSLSKGGALPPPAQGAVGGRRAQGLAAAPRGAKMSRANSAASGTAEGRRHPGHA